MFQSSTFWLSSSVHCFRLIWLSIDYWSIDYCYFCLCNTSSCLFLLNSYILFHYLTQELNSQLVDAITNSYIHYVWRTSVVYFWSVLYSVSDGFNIWLTWQLCTAFDNFVFCFWDEELSIYWSICWCLYSSSSQTRRTKLCVHFPLSEKFWKY